MMQNRSTSPKPDREGREAMYSAERQDFAYRRGAYDYLEDIAMMPRMAILGAYVRAYGLRRILDIGCGAGLLIDYLDSEVAYLGIDISPTAISEAEKRFSERASTSFHAADFRHWECPQPTLDGIVWAGIGYTWTHQGPKGNPRDWLGILESVEGRLTDGGVLILESVSEHWPLIQKVLAGRYTYETGCDLHCLQSGESPRRSVRVLRMEEGRTESIEEPSKDPPAQEIPKRHYRIPRRRSVRRS